MKKKILSVTMAVLMILSVFSCLGIGAFAEEKDAQSFENYGIIEFEKCDDCVNDFCYFFNDVADFPVIGAILAFAHALMHIVAALFN